MMGEVVADFPQAVGRERRQEGDAADPAVQRLARRVGAVAGGVTNDEKPCDPQAGDERRAPPHPPRIDDQQGTDDGGEHEPVEKKPDNRSDYCFSSRERREQALKSEARLVRRRRVDHFDGRTALWLHSRLRRKRGHIIHPFGSADPTVGRRWTASRGRASQSRSVSGQSNTPRCSHASIRAVAASRVLASRRRSWVSSQVSRARRERAEGSLSKSAGKSPKASTNSRIAAVDGAFGGGVRSSLSQVTQRLASPARVIPRLVRRRDSPSARESARLR